MRDALFLSALLTTACGGTWSNRDLEFAAALPARSELAANLPKPRTTGQPLSRKDGLNVGEPSKAYADTQEAAKNFNNLLDYFLGLLDSVRAVPPTSRTRDSRTWGPFSGKDVPGFQFRVNIALLSSVPSDVPIGGLDAGVTIGLDAGVFPSRETYGWSIQAQKLGTAEWLDLVRGTFQASAETVRKGLGTIEIPVKDFRDRVPVGDAKLSALDSIVIGYMTSTDPTLSAMAFTYAPGNPDMLAAGGYQARQKSDGSGAMAFVSKTTNALTLQFDIVSKWRSDGAGFSAARVAEGTYRGATRLECWDSAFKVTYLKEEWPGGNTVGDVQSCPTIDGV